MGLALRLEALPASLCLTPVPFQSRVSFPSPSCCSVKEWNCQLAFSADTESPVPAGEGRDQLSLLRAPGTLPFLILAPC